MKTLAIAAVAVLAAFALPFGAAFAQSGGQMGVAAGANTQTYDIPAGSKPQTVIITTRAFQQGETATPHIHHGVEMTEVISGAVEVWVKGQPVHVVHAGESFLVPREAPHDARPVPGSGPASLVVTLVIDKGTPPRVPMPDEHLIPVK